jgi:energy-coupling factor transporter ATP-binding protein EcfA2
LKRGDIFVRVALDYLVDWASDSNWKKHLINKVVMDNYENTEELLSEIIELIDKSTDITLRITKQTQKENDLKLVIKEVQNPVNINALSCDSSFALGKKLNVFYGENGSGKSSYVRIFRKLAQNYHSSVKDLKLLPNIYLVDSTEGLTKRKQTIDVSFTSNGQITPLTKIDINEEHDYLKHINVFDGESVEPLLNSNLTFSVLPQGFKYFNTIVKTLEVLRAKIDEIIISKEMERGAVFSDSSYDVIRNEINEVFFNVKQYEKVQLFIDQQHPIEPNVDTTLKDLDTKIGELEGSNVATQLKLLLAQKVKLEALVSGIADLAKKLNIENIQQVNAVIEQYNIKVQEEKKFNDEFKSSISFLDDINDQWFSFIRSAQLYYTSLSKVGPIAGERCIFCSQVVNEDHVGIIKSNIMHVCSSSQLEKDELKKQLGQNKIINAINFSKEDESLFEKEKLIERIKAIINLLNKNITFFNESLLKQESIDSEKAIDFTDITNEINEEYASIKMRIEDLSKSKDEINEIIKTYKARRLALIKAKRMRECLVKFNEAYVLDGYVQTLKTIKSGFNSTLITKKAKEAFKSIVEDNYTNTFNDFCERLKVNKVNIKLTPQRGQTFRSKYVVKESYKVTDIMSEGEQKAVAMAEFSTDLTIRRNFNTILFDDPVTSLDYKRSQLFAKLIYELSKERQVIVFTHNIMFYYYLYNECAGDKNKENKFFMVDQFNKDEKGIVTESFSGRLENLSEVTKKLKQNQQKIGSKSCAGDELEEALKAAYSNIRTWCELIVEEGFFKDLIKRYEPNIRFSAIEKIKPEFITELDKVAELFDRSCRWMIGHSQPTETQNSKANRDDFQVDIEYILRTTEIYKNKG